MLIRKTKKCLTAAALAAALALPVAIMQAPAVAQIMAGATEDLTPEEKAEKEARKACKVQICSAMHTRKAATDLSCDITKTWRKENLDRIVNKAGVSWPWGRVVCKVPMKLKSEMLTKALAGPKLEADIGNQTLTCTVETKDGNAEIRADFSPRVTFDGGKATRAVLNWGKIEAPTLVKGAMWTATATDNTFNVLQGIIVEDINAFTGSGCDEVKSEWQSQ